MIDYMVRGAVTVTADAQRRVLANGAVAIQGNEILEVGPSEALSDRYAARVVIDGTGKIAMPGLVNCHMHLPQVLMRGINDNVGAMEKLKNYIWPIQGNYDEADALASTRLGLLEMIKSGTTSFLGTGLHPRYGIPRIAQAVLDSGMRGVLSKYVMDVTGYAADSGALHPGVWETRENSLSQAVELIKQWDGADGGRLRIWFSPRSVGGVSPDLFKEVSVLAGQHGVGITTHWAEVPNNVEYIRESYGLLPAEFAQSVGLLGRNVTFAHGIHFQASELDLLAATGTSVCHCPVTNAKLAMGVAPVSDMLRRGVNVCLGNDGMPVNNTADMFREMRSALTMQRQWTGDPIFPTAAQAIEMATMNGAKAIMAAEALGSLEAGKKADLILIETRKPHLRPLHDPVSLVVWAANGGDVASVFIDGKLVMQDRRVLTMDEAAVLGEAEEHREKILTQAGVAADHVWPIIN
jgi:5-methylthioadenosine/S-adenosylhomocysteine deaminase